jgi:hypothetical protein
MTKGAAWAQRAGARGGGVVKKAQIANIDDSIVIRNLETPSAQSDLPCDSAAFRSQPGRLAA